jgi:hypothetical protein
MTSHRWACSGLTAGRQASAAYSFGGEQVQTWSFLKRSSFEREVIFSGGQAVRRENQLPTNTAGLEYVHSTSSVRRGRVRRRSGLRRGAALPGGGVLIQGVNSVRWTDYVDAPSSWPTYGSLRRRSTSESHAKPNRTKKPPNRSGTIPKCGPE